MQLRTVSRGKLRQLATAGGGPVEARLYACRVAKAPYDKNGKTYLVLDLAAALGDLDVLRAVDDHVRRVAGARFSPLLDGGAQLVVKVPPGGAVKYENDDGNPAAAWRIEDDAYVDAVVRPGAFGDFGYCWLLHRVKPHAAVV